METRASEHLLSKCFGVISHAPACSLTVAVRIRADTINCELLYFGLLRGNSRIRTQPRDSGRLSSLILRISGPVPRVGESD